MSESLGERVAILERQAKEATNEPDTDAQRVAESLRRLELQQARAAAGWRRVHVPRRAA
jgi:hypothetical protein